MYRPFRGRDRQLFPSSPWFAFLVLSLYRPLCILLLTDLQLASPELLKPWVLGVALQTFHSSYNTIYRKVRPAHAYRGDHVHRSSSWRLCAPEL